MAVVAGGGGDGTEAGGGSGVAETEGGELAGGFGPRPHNRRAAATPSPAIRLAGIRVLNRGLRRFLTAGFISAIPRERTRRGTGLLRSGSPALQRRSRLEALAALC